MASVLFQWLVSVGSVGFMKDSSRWVARLLKLDSRSMADSWAIASSIVRMQWFSTMLRPL